VAEHHELQAGSNAMGARLKPSVRLHDGDRMRRARFVGVSLLVLLGVGTSYGQNVPCPPALIVLPGAADVHCGPFEGSVQVTYHLAVPYPAKSTLADLQAKLRTLGWLPLAEDFLNPGLPSSMLRGWYAFLDGTVEPERTIHQWMADWVDLDGQVLRFALRYYTVSGGTERLTDLRVAGILTPAAMAKADLADSMKRLGVQ
jgi:hypothetical protein